MANSTLRSPTHTEVAALMEYSLRRNMAVSMFRPMEHQEPFFRLYARERLLRGGVRCTAKGTEVWKSTTPVGIRGKCRPEDYRPCKIEDVEVGDEIVGVTILQRQDIRPAKVTAKWEFREKAFKLITKRGYSVIGTHDHPVLACPPLPPRYNNSVDPDWKNSQWLTLSELKDKPDWYVRMSFGSYVDWSGEYDDDAYIHGLMDGDGSVDCYKYGVMKLAGHIDESVIPWMRDHLDRLGIHHGTYQRSENGITLEWCNLKHKREYQAWNPELTPEVMSSYICGLMDAYGHVTKDGKIQLVQVHEERIRKVHRWLLLFGIRSSLSYSDPPPHLSHHSRKWRLQISGYSVRRYKTSIGFREVDKICALENIASKRRKPCEGRLWWDRIKRVEDAGETDIVAISTSTETYISNGIVSHNSGKSTCAAGMVAATAMDLSVTLDDGTTIPMRQPNQHGRCLRMWVIGYDSKHIGQTIYRLLFRKGLFKIIKDEKSGLYRSYRPWDAADKKREKEAKDSPPLIPSRYIKPNSWDWENKKGKEFKSVVIRDPVTNEDLAEIYAFSSKADPKAGDPVDFIWIDEAIENPAHYSEWKSRLMDSRGSLIWSSWPNVQNDALADLTERALKESTKEKPLVRETVIALSDNKTIDKETLDEALGMFSTVEERRARDKGEYVTELLRMYPQFDEYQHQAVRDGDPDEVSKILRESGGIPPSDWTRELIIDPGHQHPGVLFVAIPPSELLIPGSETYVVYDELAGEAVARHDADMLAKKIKEKAGAKPFHRMIIDYQAGRQHGMGYDTRVMDNYRRALKACRVHLETGTPYFTEGSNDVGGRIGQLQSWLHPQPFTELPKLRIVRERCPNLVKQLRQYKKSAVNNYVKDDRPYPRQEIDAAVCLEYWAASHPRFVRPKYDAADGGGVWAQFVAMRDKLTKKKSSGAQIGPQYS